MPGAESNTTGIDVTQAYQTVQAQLTQVVAQTQTLTPSLQQGEGTPTSTEATTATGTPTGPSATPVPGEERCDQAAAAYPKIDITIEDDTEMPPGESFTKIWRVVNAGTCTWTPDYEVVFFSGEQLGALPSLPLNATVRPNDSVDISIDMVSPNEPGTYQGNWKLRNTAGLLFGIGPSGESPFWVRIKVVAVATETPIPTPTPTATTPVQVTGSATLSITDTLDLDSLMVNAGSADLLFRVQIVDPSRHQLVPLGATTLGIYGGAQPGLADCQGAALGPAPIFLNELMTGTYMCYRTDLGLPGWARIDGLDLETGLLNLYILTWKLP